jgi:hypothetical protein
MQALSPYPGLGVVFNITAIEEENARRAKKRRQQLSEQQQSEGYLYGRFAWRTFMTLINPRDIAPCHLFDGDTNLTLNGFYHNEFCIAVYSPRIDLDLLRRTFLDASDYGLAPFHRRLIEKVALDKQPLVFVGSIDGLGRLVTENWTHREHNLCKEAGWQYAPSNLPASLTPGQVEELNEMRRPRRR